MLEVNFWLNKVYFFAICIAIKMNYCEITKEIEKSSNLLVNC